MSSEMPPQDFADTYRSVMAMVTTYVTVDAVDVDSMPDMLDDVIRARPADALSVLTGILNTFINFLSAATDTPPAELWRLYATSVGAQLAAEESTP
ncbi:hypothetical protein ACFO9E_25700 [Streptomyces maoxianensis]|uniref:CdiI immunity protein domain-containing protein n=1 Tax=Streptomyces maoxianensis TaxID=1459942 RepID=A0ABV9GA47_9ACTN